MLWSLVAWTVLIWATRIRNILDDPGESSAQLVVPALVLALAGVAALRALTGRPRWGGVALAALTIAVWAVRLPMIVAGGHSVGFVAVHALLALVSVGLAALVIRSERATPGASDASGPSDTSGGVTASGASPEPGAAARRG